MLAWLVRILEIIALLWLLRFLWRAVAGTAVRSHSFRAPRGPFDSPHDGNPTPRVISGEMQRDPQCGTFVSTELSIKSRFRDQELHFCSQECREAFFRAQAGKSA
ncbi:MAG: hypothetical protein HY647_02640 [Acidobacteria bacterium]|nr:hypothetical protein [Acidobacteriota bacterium]